jgi:hypothetical protein
MGCLWLVRRVKQVTQWVYHHGSSSYFLIILRVQKTRLLIWTYAEEMGDVIIKVFKACAQQQ